ncbi:uncharacterized protein LOC142101738 [Mixophyes fleayi]|uniref:uncharacterized protein LOC142101738 n=1 Tax=Mixophyes fleayi TaxID=3061075 RepID=UPI003F4D868F
MAFTCQSVCILDLDPGKAPRTGPTRHSHTSPTVTLKPEASDFFPSVSLAVVLILVFISVLPMLFQSGTGYDPVSTLAGVKGKAAHFHPLLYGQPLSTQRTLESLHKNVDEDVTVLAVAKEDASQTLVCFSTNVFSLLAKQDQDQSVSQQVWEFRPSAATWNTSAGRRSQFFSVAVITQRRGQHPHCVILGPPNPVTGNVTLMEISLYSSPLERKVSSIIADKLLQHLYKTGLVPETFEVRESKRQHLIHIEGDPYIERGIVC